MAVFGLVLTLAGNALSFFMEFFYHLPPCPLCWLQRLILAMMTVLFLSCMALPTEKYWILKKLLMALILLLTLAGASIALRLMYLEQLPKEALPSCSASLERLWAIYPWWQVVKNIFFNAGDCGKTEFVWLLLSIPQWSLVLFMVLMVVEIKSLFFTRR